ncbi:protein of unknown function [Streptomyces sp. KY75]|nr:protein of unknown function [Streptomyces sp. KY75]CAD5983230.1 protein of unknown function [Streptomyces sp. KY70]
MPSAPPPDGFFIHSTPHAQEFVEQLIARPHPFQGCAFFACAEPRLFACVEPRRALGK